MSSGPISMITLMAIIAVDGPARIDSPDKPDVASCGVMAEPIDWLYAVCLASSSSGRAVTSDTVGPSHGCGRRRCTCLLTPDGRAIDDGPP